jgi:hypothetical protein
MYFSRFWCIYVLALCVQRVISTTGSNSHATETSDLVRDVRETHGQTAIIFDSILTGGETEEHTTIAVLDQRGDLPTEKSLSDVPTTADRSDS